MYSPDYYFPNDSSPLSGGEEDARKWAQVDKILEREGVELVPVPLEEVPRFGDDTNELPVSS